MQERSDDDEDAPKVEPPDRMGFQAVRGSLVDVAHADYLRMPRLSSSRARVVHQRSVAHALLDDGESTTAQDNGSIMHGLLLGKGQPVDIIEARDYRTAVAQAARDAAHRNGHVPVIRPRFDELQRAAAVVSLRMRDAGIVLDGISEQTVLWEERFTDGTAAVECKARIDHLRLGDRAQILELKTTTSAAPRDVERLAENMLYGIAAAAYQRAIWAARPDLVGRVDYYFVFVEIEPPYAISIHEPTATFLEIGTHRWRRAAQRWSRAEHEPYQGLHSLTVPQYVRRRFEDEGEA